MIQLHSNQYRWWHYWRPRRLTLRHNPPIYRWLFWVWGSEDYAVAPNLLLLSVLVLDIIIWACYV